MMWNWDHIFFCLSERKSIRTVRRMRRYSLFKEFIYFKIKSYTVLKILILDIFSYFWSDILNITEPVSQQKQDFLRLMLYILIFMTVNNIFIFTEYMNSVQFSSVAQSCPILCNSMNRSTPGLPVYHQLPELTQTHVHRVGDASRHLILCRPLLLLPPVLPSIGSFPMSHLFTSGGQSIGVSASASVLSMNIQDWFPLGLNDWISLLSKELSSLL